MKDENDNIVGVAYEGDKETPRKFKNEGEMKRKRSALVSSGDWRILNELDKDTGLKLPIHMYPTWDTKVRWSAQWMESEDTQRTGLNRVIMSSFIKMGEKGDDGEDLPPKTRYMRNMQEVQEQYQLLKEGGWVETKPPKIDVKYAPKESEEVKDKRIKEQELNARLMDMLEKEREERAIE